MIDRGSAGGNDAFRTALAALAAAVRSGVD
jgi:hypothetical protein